MKVLHIGNIANNAYNNAKILRNAGHQADVLCNDYYHIMGCPEWEELNIDQNSIDDFKPKWYKVNKSFSRPEWFVQGPLDLCLDYLVYKNEGLKTDSLWHRLGFYNRIRPRTFFEATVYLRNGVRNKLLIVVNRLFKRRFTRLKIILFKLLISNYSEVKKNEAFNKAHAAKILSLLRKDFLELFPDRIDSLQLTDVSPHTRAVKKLKKVFSYYDVIHCYATSNILPLIAEHSNYVSYEHGTIRDLPFENSPLGRITALAFAKSRSLIMTNADSVPQAKRLMSSKPIIYGQHGFLIDSCVNKISDLKDKSIIENVIKSNSKELIFFQSTRQDWLIKGNDKVLHAIKELVKNGYTDFKLILTNWGNDVAKTKIFLNTYSLDEYIVWIDPLSKPNLLKLYTEVDIILDQFNIPCIGSTPLEIFSIKGGALMTYLDDNMIEEFYGETIPLLNASAAQDIYRHLRLAISGEISVDRIKDECFTWLEKTHSEKMILSKMLEAYNQL